MHKNMCRKVVFIFTIFLMILSLSFCSSMEQKREKFMSEGKASFAKGDYITARLQFKNALQLDPELAEGHLWLGKTELHLNNPRGAYGSLSKAVAINPNLFEGQIILGNLLLLGRRVDDAEAKAKLVLAKEPDNPDALMLSAEVALARHQLQQALEILAKVRSLDPHKVEAYLMQASIELNQKNPSAAAASLDEGLKANPRALALYEAQARLEESQKQFDQAEATLKKAEEIAPKNTKLLDELARLYVLQKQYDKAEEVLRTKWPWSPIMRPTSTCWPAFWASGATFDEGEKLLKDFIAKHPEPPGQVHAGQFLPGPTETGPGGAGFKRNHRQQSHRTGGYSGQGPVGGPPPDPGAPGRDRETRRGNSERKSPRHGRLENPGPYRPVQEGRS